VPIKSFLAKLTVILLIGVAIASLEIWLQPATVVLAHADLVRSDPAAEAVLPQSPARVVLWFSESIDIQFSAIRVVDAQNKRWDNGDYASYQNDPATIAVSLQNLPLGSYTVAWHSTSTDDGHSLDGSFVFYVGISPAGVPAETALAQPLLPSPPEPFLHWLELLGALAAAGILIFELAITRPVLAAGEPAGLKKEMDYQLEHRALIALLLAAGISFFASMGELFSRAATASATLQSLSSGRAAELIMQTHWGHLWLWRMVLLLAAVIIALLVAADWSTPRSGKRHWQMLALPLAALALLTFSLVSHDASDTTIRATAVFSDYVHLLAASVWIGGIIYLAVVMPPAMKLYHRKIKETGSGTFCPTSHVNALGRFSFVSIMSAGVLLITGLYSSWAQVAILPALMTPYGITLLAKIGLIVLLAGLGAVNLVWVRPRLAEDRKALSVLDIAASGQATLAIIIVLAVGMLVSLNPARQAVSSLGLGQPVTTPPSTETGLILWGVEVLLIGLMVIPARWLTNYFSKRRP
jgi:copper transport protein